MDCFINSSLYLANAHNKGRGVFTMEDIQVNKIIEASPVIVLNASDRFHLIRTLLRNYIFEWPDDKDQYCCISLGYISLYNHSYRANCEYLKDFKAGIIRIQTVRQIERGEELTINYNGCWDDPSPVWFNAE